VSEHPSRARVPIGSGSAWAYALAVPAAVFVLVPFAWLVCASLKGNADFFTSPFLPRGDGFLGVAWDRVTLDNFRNLFAQTGIARALLVSALLSSVTAVLATRVCAMAGYALARLEFVGKRLAAWLVLAAIIVPPTLLVAPGYQVLFRLGLLDTVWGLVLPAIAPAFGVYLFRQAVLAGVPRELLEAARMDGCGDVRAFFRVVLPLVQPMVSAFLLLGFLGTWNNFLTPQVVLQDPGKFPLAVSIAQLKNVYYQDYGLLMAGTVFAVLPVAVLFLLLQRDFVAGLTRGAVKG
jgi:ABC-type glycerol-3-phosphate transport system permease component